LLVGLNKGRIVSKYIIAVVFLLGLMQGKTEAILKFDGGVHKWCTNGAQSPKWDLKNPISH